MATRFRKTRIPNLDYAEAYGTYYGRVKVRGKLIREMLGTTQREAEPKLGPWLAAKRGVKSRVRTGTFNSLVERYYGWIEGRKALGELDEETVEYKKQCLSQIRHHWPEFSTKNIHKFDQAAMEKWEMDHAKEFAPTRVNGAVTVLREMLALAVKDRMISETHKDELCKGMIYVKVKYDYKRLTMDLPEPDVAVALQEEVHRRCKSRGADGYWLFDGILYGGSRIEAAGDVLWEDIKWSKRDAQGKVTERGQIFYRNAKYGNYITPLFPELEERLLKLKAWSTKTNPTDRVFPTRSLQTVLTSACKALQTRGLKCPHLSAHDIRHIFATRLVELGVDWVTLASYLGHRDNGRTAMMVYAHVRRGHSFKVAGDLQLLPGSKVYEKPKPDAVPTASVPAFQSAVESFDAGI